MVSRKVLPAAPPKIQTSDTRRVKPPAKRADPFYGSPDWRHLMAAIIKQRGRRCEDPAHSGERKAGIRVYGDHIVELRDGGAPLDPANVMLRCGSCHTRKTAAARRQRYGVERAAAADARQGVGGFAPEAETAPATALGSRADFFSENASVQTKPDWDAVKRAYADNTNSIRAIAREHGLSDTAIHKRAAAENWPRSAPDGLQCKPVQTSIAAAAAAADAADTPRDPATRGQALIERMLDELDAETSVLGELEQLIFEATRDDKDDRRREAMLRAISLPKRAQTLRTLLTAAKTFGVPAGGKKQRAQNIAAAAAKSGRFATPAPPKLVVDNG